MNVMKNVVMLGILLFGAILVIPNSEAQTQGGGGGGDEKCIDHTIVAVVGAINAGTLETCLTYPSAVAATNTQWAMEARLMGPVITSVGTATISVAFIAGSPVGCTAVAGTPTSNSVGGTLYSQAFGMAMTSRECAGTLEYRISLSIAPTTLFLTQMVFNVHALDQVESNIHSFGCGADGLTGNTFNTTATQCTIPQIDNENRICDNSTFGTACNRLTINAVLTGQLAQLNYQCQASGTTPNAFNPNTNTCTTLAQLNYQCNASRTTPNAFNPNSDACNELVNFVILCGATAATPNSFNPNSNTCTIPAFTATLSGTLQLGNITISSWPTLLANVTNSGAITVTNGGGQNITVSGNLNTNMTGSLTVTNGGGQNITITSWPQLLATLNGTLNVTSSCGNTNVTPCYDNTNGNFNFTGNFTSNTTNPADFRSTAAYTQALWTLILFILCIAMAEWKKDLFYHLFAVIIGIYGIVTIPTVLGVERMVILGLMVYQMMRIFRIYRSERNDLQRPEANSL